MVVFRRPFGIVKQIWHLDMGLGLVTEEFDLVEEEDYLNQQPQEIEDENEGDEIFRPVRNNKHIYFTPHTKLEKDEEEGLDIEDYAFDLYHMKEIEKLADDNRFLIDFVGKLENLQPKITTNKNNQDTTRVKFEMCDGRYRVNVTLFDQFGINVEEALKNLDPNEIFVIISSARVGRYEGSPNISNYPATRFYINPNHYSITELKVVMKNKEKMDTTMTEDDSKHKIMTVKEIRKLKSEFKEKYVICEVTIKKVDEKEKWYYTKCTGCKMEIQKQDGLYKCGKCPRIIPYPDKRFRVCTVCSNNTGSMVILLPDDDIIRIIDNTVVDIHAECKTEQEEDNFPEILRFFVNQKYKMTIELNEDNLKNGSTVYEAKEMVENNEVSDSFDPNKEVTTYREDIPVIEDTEGEGNNIKTPAKGNSTNMKLRMRKNVEPLTYDSIDQQPVIPLKNIKKEKVTAIAFKVT
ncbi:DUF223 domain-containing protein [Heracleum sosnowskyi]|uniref:DUF223 domain-containing protein n=1 Tax=Heracleum sosnowskyi TaxID=360622 RepID=A0AAD8H6J3_9APIA|nr:DUF223 domain-containing protein [Heracleum sosnowskyi]